MKKYKKKVILKKWVRITLLIIIFVLLFCGAANVILSFKEKEQEINYGYNILQNLDYKVYLVENDFYDELILPKGQNYTSYFVDKIQTEFTYNFSGTKKQPLLVEYSIDGTIYGEYKGDTNSLDSKIWAKAENLLPLKSITYDNTANFNLSENIEIDFNYYNLIAADFRRKISIPMKSFLRVIFNITVKSDDLINDKKEIIMDIPLLQEAFMITENYTPNNQKVIYFGESDKVDVSKLIFGVSSITTSLILLTLTYKLIFNVRPKNKYTIKLNKILKDNGDIIVEVVNAIDFSKFEVVDVKNFNEMLDLEEGLREPIIFYETREDYEGEFVLVNNNILYRYILNDK